MKIRENYLHEALKAERKDQPSRAAEARRSPPVEQTEVPNKPRQAESPVKDEPNFAALLEAPAKPQKADRRRDDSSGERREDDKSEKTHEARDKESTDGAAGDGKAEKYESGAGGQTGGQSGFGEPGVHHAFTLNENFAARSILHIADLERLVSTIRTQIGLGGEREIYLQLKRSMLEGLRIKIITDGSAKVQIEFLAASEKVRAEVDKHAAELAGILRGRGINLQTIKTGTEAGGRDDETNGDESLNALKGAGFAEPNNDDLLADNTFEWLPPRDGSVYNA